MQFSFCAIRNYNRLLKPTIEDKIVETLYSNRVTSTTPTPPPPLPSIQPVFMPHASISFSKEDLRVTAGFGDRWRYFSAPKVTLLR